MSSNVKYKRYLWIDNLKLFACFMVVVGHLYMSIMAGGWIRENNILYCWPIQTVYTFHVPLFFVCSGFLYQATAPNNWSIKKHIRNIKKKAIALGVPYVTFSAITLLLKNVFSAEVNNAATPFLKTLLWEPIAPYWYLYTLFLLFCLIPPAVGDKKKNALVGMMALSCLIKIIYIGWLSDKALPDLLAKVMTSAIWFCMGMMITEFPFRKSNVANAIAVGSIFVAGISSYFVYGIPNEDKVVQFIFAAVFVVTSTYFFQIKDHYNTNGFVSHSVKYFMPVYVLHTIVAAGMRTVLLKIGISSGIVHFVIGLLVSVFVPVCIYNIAEKHWWLLLWFEPIKAIKMKKQGKTKGEVS